LFSIAGKKLGKFDIPDEETAKTLKADIETGSFSVESLESKAQKRHPAPPFTTSTLQQEASRKCGFSARQTMQVAQKLYEGVEIGGETQGLITYIRTDGVQIVPEAVAACRQVIEQEFGGRYLPGKPRVYKTKAKNAQEAHEAIRPTDLARLPEHVASNLDKDGARLYKLIWQRAIASQMESAEFERTTVDISVTARDGKSFGLRATGSVLLFDGFLKLYEEGKDDSDSEDAKRLPKLDRGEALDAKNIAAKQHFTEPPPRFTEATLVKKMEELGIGRPSTYASTLSVLRDREYVRFDKKRLIPEDKGRLVTAFLESFFNRYVEYDFTADLEQKLDLISAGNLQWKDVLRQFWSDFTGAVNEIKDLRISEVLDALNEILGPHVFPDKGDGSDPRKCPSCDDGQIGLKIGRFGAFIGCTNYPDCRYTRQFSEGDENESAAISPDGKHLGDDPETGLAITLRTGRFGPYVQLGEAQDGEKPKRASVPKTFDAATVDLEKALALLALPRIVGDHPETGKPIKSNFGRYGPYIEHDGIYANLGDAEEIFTIGLNRAVTLIAEKKAPGGGPRRASVLRELGEHPEQGGAIQLLSGRYGPYVKHGKINATLPKSADPEKITLDEAVQLIAAKAEKGGTKKKGAKAAKTTKTTAKKATASKTKGRKRETSASKATS
ncbi:MAG: type I DNA topoisomerase, partial [Methyloligellaceae bacterium]